MVIKNSQIQIINIINNNDGIFNTKNNYVNSNFNNFERDNDKEIIIENFNFNERKNFVRKTNKLENYMKNVKLNDIDSLEVNLNGNILSNECINLNENKNYIIDKEDDLGENDNYYKIDKKKEEKNEKSRKSKEIKLKDIKKYKIKKIIDLNKNNNYDFNLEKYSSEINKKQCNENQNLNDNIFFNNKSGITQDNQTELNDSLEKSKSSSSYKQNTNLNLNTKSNSKSKNKNLSINKSNFIEKNNKNKSENESLNENITDKKTLKCNKTKKKLQNVISENSNNYINNPQIPYEYLHEIHQNLIEEEMQIQTFFGYMKNHCDINEQMRAILIDWIIEVHSKFNLKEETLFLCVFIIDKFLKCEIIPRSKLQLLGVTSIMIACKQEEIYSPSIRDFVCITDNAYTKKEIFEMEFQILKTMEFNTVSPSSLRFFELIAMDFNFNSKEYNFGLYLLELYLIDYRMTKFIPSVIACSAAYIVMKFFKLENYPKIYTDWNINSGSSSVVKDCAREMCFLVDNITGSTLQATKKKFSHEKYDMVSEINFF